MNKETKEITEMNVKFELSQVDVFEENNTLWFCLSDVGKILDLSKSSVRMMKNNKWFDDDEVKLVSKKLTADTQSRTHSYVSESALYRILNRSNSPKAKPFERWVTKEVIPSIRKTGSYSEKTPDISMIIAESIKQTAAAIALLSSQSTETKQQVNQIDERVKAIEKKLEQPTAEPDFYTITGYCKNNNIHISEQDKIKYSRLAKKIAEELSEKTAKVPDSRWGSVNGYTIIVLNKVFEGVKHDC